MTKILTEQEVDKRLEAKYKSKRRLESLIAESEQTDPKHANSLNHINESIDALESLRQVQKERDEKDGRIADLLSIKASLESTLESTVIQLKQQSDFLHNAQAEVERLTGQMAIPWKNYREDDLAWKAECSALRSRVSELEKAIEDGIGSIDSLRENWHKLSDESKVGIIADTRNYLRGTTLQGGKEETNESR